MSRGPGDRGRATSTTSATRATTGRGSAGRRVTPRRCCRRPSRRPTASAAAGGPRSPRSSCAVLALLPAVIAVGIAALAAQAGRGRRLEEASPIRHDTYQGIVVTLVMLFCAAQAPELFGRDQRYGVLPLYFSRAPDPHRLRPGASRRALSLAVLLVIVVPQLVLIVGRVFVAARPGDRAAPRRPPTVPRYLPSARPRRRGLLGGLAAVIAAWTPRRAYATAGDHRRVHHPADRRRDHRRAGAPATRPGRRPVQPGRRHRRAQRRDLRDGRRTARPSSPLDLPGWVYIVAAVVGIVGRVAARSCAATSGSSA